ncbi:MAG: response regulator transcription factor [Phycisphaerales bacterium]
MSIRIVLADDHTILRQSLVKSFKEEKDIEIVGEAKDGRHTAELVKQLQPDLVIMDIQMPDLNGLEATRRIVKEFPQIKVIGLSMHSNDKYIREMFRAGASGYMLKNCSFEELVKAVRTIMKGKIFIGASIGDLVISKYINIPEKEGSAFSVLSEREREILQLLAEGRTTKIIARLLHISPKTVEGHRLKMMDKLNIDSIANLTKYAIQEGMTTPEP